MELLQISRLCPGNTRVVIWQPDNGRRHESRDEFQREQDLQHLFLVRKWQRRQARRCIGVRARSTLGRREVVQRFKAFFVQVSILHAC